MLIEFHPHGIDLCIVVVDIVTHKVGFLYVLLPNDVGHNGVFGGTLHIELHDNRRCGRDDIDQLCLVHLAVITLLAKGVVTADAILIETGFQVHILENILRCGFVFLRHKRHKAVLIELYPLAIFATALYVIGAEIVGHRPEKTDRMAIYTCRVGYNGLKLHGLLVHILYIGRLIHHIQFLLGDICCYGI